MRDLAEFVSYVLTQGHYYFAGSYTHQVLIAFWDLFRQLWFFLVIGILASTAISTFWSKNQLASFFNRSAGLSVVTATVIGILSPIPTYIAIPLVVVLYRAGVPPAPLFSFLVSSPLMNPILFSMTAGAFGYQLAFALVISALTLGISTGLIVQALISRGRFRHVLCKEKNPAMIPQNKPILARTVKTTGAAFVRELGKMTRFAGKYFAVGILVAAAVKVLVPAQWVISVLGTQGSFSVLVAAAAGIPLYACGGGAIPVVKTLVDLGMDKGAVLAFFISGPATKLSTLVALKAAVRREAFILYLAVSLIGATVFGLAYSAW